VIDRFPHLADLASEHEALVVRPQLHPQRQQHATDRHIILGVGINASVHAAMGRPATPIRRR
jgi:hypothetical protein